MNISVNANYLRVQRNTALKRTPLECISICAEAGFSVLDYTPNIYCDEWKKSVDETIEATEKTGIYIEQSHAPFNFYSRRSPELFFELLDRSVIAAYRIESRRDVRRP